MVSRGVENSQPQAGKDAFNHRVVEEAEVDARPQLEIHADDVACSHGVTIGRLDTAAVFYLRSRGLSADSARSMLTHAFAEEMVERIPDPALKHQLSAVLCAWLTRHLGSAIPTR